MVDIASLPEEDRVALKKTGVPVQPFDPGNQFTPRRMGVPSYARLQVPTSIAAGAEIVATLDDLRARIEALRRENITSEWRYGLRLQELVSLANHRLKVAINQK